MKYIVDVYTLKLQVYISMQVESVSMFHFHFKVGTALSKNVFIMFLYIV